MKMVLSHLSLRVMTTIGLCGVDIPFKDGLIILRAENSSGKSTCIQAIIYALGLEGMLSASHEVPLPHVMTELIEINGEEFPVLESEVLLEIKNEYDHYLTIRRTAKGERNKHLVTVWEGPALSKPDSIYEKQDYFVRERGAATRELGFHHRLEKFIGWDLPEVLRYDGKTSPLYLECIFHLFIVEQKRGWSGFQTNLPTQYRIREVDRRAIEFLLGFDTYQNIIERQELNDQLLKVKRTWKNVLDHSYAVAEENNGIIQNLPEEPVAIWPPTIPPKVMMYRENKWIPIEEILSNERNQLTEIEENEIPLINAALEQNKKELQAYEAELIEKQIGTSRLLEDIGVERFNLDGMNKRLTALEEDLRHNKDVKRLRDLGSIKKMNIMHGTCPTCHQQINDSLLSNDLKTDTIMTIDENIGFLEEQKKAINIMKINSEKVILAKEKRLSVLREVLEELRYKIRNTRKNLVSDDRIPSFAAIHEKIRLSNSLEKHIKAIDIFNDNLESFSELSTVWLELQTKLKKLPEILLSSNDIEKINIVQSLFINQVTDYGLTSVNPKSLLISQDSYKPTHDGFDLQFDLSASDLVRAIWAFLISFLEIARNKSTNHLGLLIMDEPRQQSAKKASVKELLNRLSESGKYNQQVIFATSEEQDLLNELLKDIPHSYINFEGKILSYLECFIEDNEFLAEVENDFYVLIEDSLNSFIDDVTRINIWTDELNEVLGANVENLTNFRLEDRLQIDNGGNFQANLLVTASLELSEYFAGETINESTDVDFLIQCIGKIQKSIIKEMEVSSINQYD